MSRSFLITSASMTSVLMTSASKPPVLHPATVWFRTQSGPDPRAVMVTRVALWTGIVLVLLWPEARGHSAWIGWLPLWLVGMPLSAWCGLHRCRWRQLLEATVATGSRRRSRRAQALRHLPRRGMGTRLRRAA